MERFEPEAVMDLVAAAGAVGHDEIVGGRPCAGAGNSESSAMASDTSMVSAPYPKTPAMPQQLDSITRTSSPGTARSTVSTAPMAAKAFWWQWPCR